MKYLDHSFLALSILFVINCNAPNDKTTSAIAWEGETPESQDISSQAIHDLLKRQNASGRMTCTALCSYAIAKNW